MLPLFLGQTIVLFEANMSILNVYAECSEPQKFFPAMITTHVVIVSMCMLVGLLSYAAFGDATEDVILFNLPKGSDLTVTIQVMYMLNIMGSFSLVI